MNIENELDEQESKIRSKTLLVLGLTFILPLMITLVAIYVFVLSAK